MPWTLPINQCSCGIVLNVQWSSSLEGDCHSHIRAAQQSGLAGCTRGRAGGLHNLTQGCQISFFDAKFHKFGFFIGHWGKKNCLAVFGGSSHMLSDWCLGFLIKILLKSVIIIGFVRQCFVYFLFKHVALWSVCDPVVFAHLQCGIDARTSGRMDCDVSDVNSTPDESAKETSYFHVHGSHL